MKLLVTATSLCLALAAGTACAAEPTEKDAIAMVERGAALIKSKGKEEMMKHINAKDPDFVQGSLYIDMRDVKTGIVLAHPINPSIVGKDLTDVPDANGKKYRREIIELAAKSRARAGSTTSTRIRPAARSSRRPPTSSWSTTWCWKPASTRSEAQTRAAHAARLTICRGSEHAEQTADRPEAAAGPGPGAGAADAAVGGAPTTAWCARTHRSKTWCRCARRA